MSIRRAPPPRPPSVGGSPPQTISESLGIEAGVAPRKWPAAFVPEFREVPEVSDTVVEDVFEEMDIDVEATGGLFGIKKKDRAVKGDAPSKKGSMLANLKAAKEKANEVVRKAGSVAKSGVMAGAKAAGAGAKAVATNAANKSAGMQKYDYKIYNSEEFIGVLAVAKKGADGEADDKNKIKAFKSYKHSKVTKHAEKQEAQMMRHESLLKKIKGHEPKLVSHAASGRNAVVLGYSQVEANPAGTDHFVDAIYSQEEPAALGEPTIVQLDAYDTNKVENMMPISALVIEALDTDTLKTNGQANGKDLITVTMQAIPEAKIATEVVNTLTKDEVDFQYTLCVHGLYVGEEKALMMGRKILVPQRNPGDIAAYGIATPNGIESALYHAMEGKEIDLLYLWTCYRLVQGVHSLGQSNLDTTQKAAMKELLGEGLGIATMNTFSADVDGPEFDDVNNLRVM